VAELESVSELLGGGAKGRKRGSVCLGSATDSCIATSFANKKAVTEGDSKAAKGHIGFVCKKGHKPDSLNQDSWTVLQVTDNFSIYGVFDGHGPDGHHISNFVKDHLPRIILQDVQFKEWMQAEVGSSQRDLTTVLGLVKGAFGTVQAKVAEAADKGQFDAYHAGSTATICIYDHKTQKYLVAHVADSTCVLGKFNRTAKALTRDHKPELDDERARIEGAGGQVIFDGYANHRVYDKTGEAPGMNMSRCLGDLHAHRDCGVIAEPETKILEVGPDDSVLLLCSDGVWEFIEPDAAVSLVMPFYKKGQATQAAEKLSKLAWDRWMKEEKGAVVDDITVICVFLNKKG
jgi:serine/threonine protein phosphatase PrpC